MDYPSNHTVKLNYYNINKLRTSIYQTKADGLNQLD